ncbi:hypothetical protein FEI13_09070 [Halomonas urmiana]|uniref:Uncharacterized protein n=1 Tax=Halomonas urmiana TaxID=490901 RepID=A0A5R8MH87_9GAMM|nr:hypothetical protein [Halomonas urmiana]TLF50569.1 hypothetical protein FEI13_09070 [Halomonas urmiana]
MDDYDQDLGLDLFEDEFIESHDSTTQSATANPSDKDVLACKPCFFESEYNSGKPLDTYPDELRYEALRRLSYIKWFEKRISGGWTEKNLQPLLDEAEFLQALGKRCTNPATAAWQPSAG